MRYKPEQSGFSAVELLITLFIASVFLISGFELYAAIVKNGGNARMMASASSVVTDYIQRYKSTATNPCTVQTPLTNSPITISGLSNVTVTVAIQCPYNSGTYTPETTPQTVSEVIATLKYGTPQQTVSNATYVSNPNTGLVTNGLVLDLDAGNTASYPGSGITWTDLSGNGNSGTLVGGVTYSSANGGSLSFNGSTGYVTKTTFPGLVSEASVGVWINTASTSSNTMIVQFNGTGIYVNGFTVGKVLAFFDGNSGNNSAADESSVSVNDGLWHYIAATNNGSTTRLYVDGIFQKTFAETLDTSSTNLFIGSNFGTSGFFNGMISGVHVYNRALSPSEINQDYNALRSRY